MMKLAIFRAFCSVLVLGTFLLSVHNYRELQAAKTLTSVRLRGSDLVAAVGSGAQLSSTPPPPTTGAPPPMTPPPPPPQRPLVCVGVWGMSRSAFRVHASFDRMLLRPLRRAQIEYRVFQHTFLLPHHRKYTNPWTDEYEVELPRDDYLFVPANVVVAEDEPADIDIEPFLRHGNPWAVECA